MDSKRDNVNEVKIRQVAFDLINHVLGIRHKILLAFFSVPGCLTFLKTFRFDCRVLINLFDVETFVVSHGIS